MSTLYWITVLGNLSVLAAILLGIMIACTMIIGFHILVDSSCSIDEHNKASINKAVKIEKKLLIFSIIPILMTAFIPSKEQLYVIYGVGTVVDYAKGSKEVQKLPDNAVKALNMWLENVNKEKKDSINN